MAGGVTRAERRREERGFRLAPTLDPKVPKLRHVEWQLPAALVERVREITKVHGLSENQIVEMLIGAGIEAYEHEKRRRLEAESLVKISPVMPPKLKSSGALLGGRG